MSDVDDYWGQHTVRDQPFESENESKAWDAQLGNAYPLMREFTDFPAPSGRVLDYGCGPGNGMAHILGRFGPGIMKVHGVDVSDMALGLARRRMELHSFIPAKWELHKVSDDAPRLDFPNDYFDFVNCQGVLHHTSHPQDILKEFHRVLRPGGNACVMVYNRESIFYHLEIAYNRAILERRPGTQIGDVDELFRKSTDGENCPISIAYRPEVFSEMCLRAGFECEYRGGYFALSEYIWLFSLFQKAKTDTRLEASHREFLGKIRMHRGYPTVAGKACGIGGVYTLRKVDDVDSID